MLPPTAPTVRDPNATADIRIELQNAATARAAAATLRALADLVEDTVDNEPGPWHDDD